MKFVVLTDYIFKLSDLEYCSHAEECIYFEFGRKFFLYDDRNKYIFECFVKFIDNDSKIFDVKKHIEFRAKIATHEENE